MANKYILKNLMIYCISGVITCCYPVKFMPKKEE